MSWSLVSKNVTDCRPHVLLDVASADQIPKDSCSRARTSSVFLIMKPLDLVPATYHLGRAMLV